MIGKLRRKFVLAMMSVVTIILLIVFTAALISTKREISIGSEEFLRHVIEEPRLRERPGGQQPLEIKQLYVVVEQQQDGDWEVLDWSYPLAQDEQELD